MATEQRLKELKEKGLSVCDKHKEEYKYNPFGYFCISCYNDNLIAFNHKYGTKAKALINKSVI